MDPVFIHIPKNAGTSIRAALNIRHFDAHAHTTHVPWGDAAMTAWYESVEEPFLFTCLRHPCDRALSIHQHFARRTRRLNRMNVVVEELCHQMNLNDFWCNADIEHLQAYVPHLRTQHSFLEGAPCDMLLKYEQLADDWARLTETIGNPGLTLLHYNASSRGPWKDLLSTEATNRILDLFAVDFEKYDYRA